MSELARSAPEKGTYRVYLLGGATAVLAGWRSSTIEADLYVERDEVLRDVQAIKERLRLNIELARPEHFVPALDGSERRHVFIDRIGNVDFFHYDPYAQLLSNLVRGFRQDMLDAERFVASGMVDAHAFRSLVEKIPGAAFARYPALTREAVLKAVRAFLAGTDS